MNSFFQRLNKIPVKVFLILYIVLYIVLTFIGLSLSIERRSLVAYALSLPVALSLVLFVIRFKNYIKSKSSVLYYIACIFLRLIFFALPAELLIVLDVKFKFGGFLALPGILLLIILFIVLIIRSVIKKVSKKLNRKNDMIDYLQEQDSGEGIAIFFSEGHEIEFTYDNVRYLFIHENGRYYFKRITAIDPYEYEILAEADEALACVNASEINGKKITGLWPDIEDITVY